MRSQTKTLGLALPTLAAALFLGLAAASAKEPPASCERTPGTRSTPEIAASGRARPEDLGNPRQELHDAAGEERHDGVVEPLDAVAPSTRRGWPSGGVRGPRGGRRRHSSIPPAARGDR
jgi:hypothetical protein